MYKRQVLNTPSAIRSQNELDSYFKAMQQSGVSESSIKIYAEERTDVYKRQKYGQPFEVTMRLLGPNGKSAKVKTGWIINNGENHPRLVTAFVDKE